MIGLACGRSATSTGVHAWGSQGGQSGSQLGWKKCKKDHKVWLVPASYRMGGMEACAWGRKTDDTSCLW